MLELDVSDPDDDATAEDAVESATVHLAASTDELASTKTVASVTSPDRRFRVVQLVGFLLCEELVANGKMKSCLAAACGQAMVIMSSTGSVQYDIQVVTRATSGSALCDSGHNQMAP